MPAEASPSTSASAKTRLLSDAAALIRIRSANPPGGERSVAEWLATRLESVADEVCIEPVAEGRANLVASFGFGTGPTLLLCSHSDVVPVQADGQWEPIVREGRLIGRGACDAKGALAAMIGACERIAADPRGLRGTLVFGCVADEESNAEGVLALVARGLSADAAIIGEPTDNLIVLESRGSVRVAVRFAGLAAHASSPSQGVNAIYAAARFILAIEALDFELNARSLMGSCAATIVDGGSKLNVIPDVCVVQVDRRLGPHETPAGAIRELEASLAIVTTEAPGISYELSPAGLWVDPFEIDAGSEFARLLLDAVKQPAPGPVFRAVSDAPHLIAAGIPTAILGPGSIDLAHSADESVNVRDLERAVDLYECVARRYLGSRDPPL